VSYPKGTKFGGIEWQEDYGELDLDINNPQEEAIQNIDVTVQVLEGVIFYMGQLSDVSGVESHPIGVPDLKAHYVGPAGKGFTLTFSGEMARVGDNPFSPTWKLFCPRLSGKTTLKLVLATSAEKNTGAQPTHVHVFGNYEHVDDGGRKTVRVNTKVAVDR